jgi:hypothetical protein
MIMLVAQSCEPVKGSRKECNKELAKKGVVVEKEAKNFGIDFFQLEAKTIRMSTMLRIWPGPSLVLKECIPSFRSSLRYV